MRPTAVLLVALLVACGADDTSPRATFPPESVPPERSTGADEIVGAVQAYGREHPDAFAGLYLCDGRVCVGFSKDADAHVAALRTRVTRPELLDVFEARWSQRELEALQARITDDTGELARMGIDVSTVGIDVVDNRVEVGVRTRRGRASRVLRERYGADRVVVEEGVEVHPT